MDALKILDRSLLYFAETEGTEYVTETELPTKLHEYLNRDLLPDLEIKAYPNQADILFIRSIIFRFLEEKLLRQHGQYTFYITIDGKHLLRSAPWPFRNKPYRYRRFKEQMSAWWSVFKILAIVINSLAVLYFAYLQTKPH